MDAEGLEKTRAAGKIAARCREWAREAIQPGVKLRTILETIESMIREAAPLLPSRHDLPERVRRSLLLLARRRTVYEEGDVVKVDMGVHVDGWIADTACTVDLSTMAGGTSSNLRGRARGGVSSWSPDAHCGWAAVERTITKAGFEPVRNLTGHGLDRWKVHCAPQIPSYGERGGGRLAEGMVVAIEPFACTGRGFIHEAGRAEVFMLVRPPRKARGVDKEVLKAMQSWRGLPIARRYFDHLDRDAVEDTISKLARQGVLVRPPLVEQAGVLVAQPAHLFSAWTASRSSRPDRAPSPPRRAPGAQGIPVRSRCFRWNQQRGRYVANEPPEPLDHRATNRPPLQLAPSGPASMGTSSIATSSSGPWGRCLATSRNPSSWKPPGWRGSC